MDTTVKSEKQILTFGGPYSEEEERDYWAMRQAMASRVELPRLADMAQHIPIRVLYGPGIANRIRFLLDVIG